MGVVVALALFLSPRAAMSAHGACGCLSAVACPDRIIPVDQSAPAAPKATGDRLAAATPIWKTISLGTHGSAASLRKALKAAGCHVGQLADEALAGPGLSVSRAKTDVDLVVLSLGDLGFGTETALAHVYARAVRLGFGLCPAEVGPQLRLQYLNQPLGEFLRIAMQPVATGEGELVALLVGNGGAGLVLIGGEARPDLVLPQAARFVFVRPR
jgi:hypothetical protein